MKNKKINIHIIVGARPNFMKAAPIYNALSVCGWATPTLIHTGQHYDVNMSDIFFTDLGMPEPDHHLGIGGGSHGEQLGKTMMAYENLCHENRPDFVMVFGDVNATIACTLMASRMQIPCGHIEAGLRSRDMQMPEEVNRILTDQISDILWTPSTDADVNLKSEGINDHKIKMVGNIMIDSLVSLRPTFETSSIFSDHNINKGEYTLATIHRPSNVDDKADLEKTVNTLIQIADRVNLVFPCHPRTQKNLEKFNMMNQVANHDNILVLDPLGYKDFMALVSHAKCLITDSGGIQEETTYLGVPCLTLRNSTERPITLDQGTNILTPPAHMPDNVIKALDIILGGDTKSGQCPPLWDGNTATRIADHLKEWFDARS